MLMMTLIFRQIFRQKTEYKRKTQIMMIFSSSLKSLQNAMQRYLWRNIFSIFALAALISAVITYFTIIGGDGELGAKPSRVFRLLLVNAGLLGILVLFIGWRVFGLWSSLSRSSAKATLQRRVVLLFGAVTILPTLIVSIFAALFFNIGIQTWFNQKVEQAVEESLTVAQAYLNEHMENMRGDAIAMAADLNMISNLALSNPQEFNRIVEAQTELRLLTESVVVYRNRIIAKGKLSFALAFENIAPEIMERLANGEVVLTTEDGDKIRAVIALSSLPDSYLVIGRLVDSRVLAHIHSTQGAVTEYRALGKQQGRMQMAFSMVFIALAAFLLLAAIWYGITFSSRLTTPISQLVRMAERVRGGDYSARVALESGDDEIGGLVRTFNRMTGQLEAQRGDLMLANRQLDERRRFSEAVLSGVSAGVIALNADKKITIFNRSSATIFNKVGIILAEGTSILELLPGIGELLLQAESLSGEIAHDSISISGADKGEKPEKSDKGEKSDKAEKIEKSERNDKNLTLHVRVTAEKREGILEGFIVTFDDITMLVAAQRSAAWADVARRVAHEIKNPLTPIQLSAERLKKKYIKYIVEDQENYVRYIDTIEKHVADIGRMVEEFVAFARMPTARFVTEDLASILRKSVFSAQVAFPAIEIISALPENSVYFICDERQISQIITNLIKNAAESIEAGGEAISKGIIKVALETDNEKITISISDNGIGFPNETPGNASVLEPYVTTRVNGMGLGVSIVKKIVDDHKGLLYLENNSDCGAKVTLYFPQHCDIKES